MFAISQELSKRQIAAFPARTAQEAQFMIAQFSLTPDVVVIDCASPGACSFAEGVLRTHREVRIVGIVSDCYQCKRCGDRLAARFEDPEDGGPDRIPHYADIIQELVRKQRRRAHTVGKL